MSGMQVCATNQSRCFTSKNSEKAPNCELRFSPEQALIFKHLIQKRIIFDNLVSNVENYSCFSEK